MMILTGFESKASAAALGKIVEWCQYNEREWKRSQSAELDKGPRTKDLSKWEQEFYQVDQELLFEIINVRSFKLGNLIPSRSCDLSVENALQRLLPCLKLKNLWTVAANLLQI